MSGRLRPLGPLISNIETRDLAQNVRIGVLFDCGSNGFQLSLTLAEL